MRFIDCRIDRGLVLTLPDGRTVRVLLVDVTRNRDGQRARIGVDAPRDVPVHRSEVADALRRRMAEDRGREGIPAPVSGQAAAALPTTSTTHQE